MEEIDGMYLEKVLKNWASQYRPPSNSRRRLLWLAGHPKTQPRFHAEVFEGFSSVSLDWSILLFQHLMVPSLQTGVPTSRHLI